MNDQMDTDSKDQRCRDSCFIHVGVSYLGWGLNDKIDVEASGELIRGSSRYVDGYIRTGFHSRFM